MLVVSDGQTMADTYGHRHVDRQTDKQINGVIAEKTQRKAIAPSPSDENLPLVKKMQKLGLKSSI